MKAEKGSIRVRDGGGCLRRERCLLPCLIWDICETKVRVSADGRGGEGETGIINNGDTPHEHTYCACRSVPSVT